eukprot:CAMPEP_0178956876 /NCGR_PEP_ID=MMETSP0789-20121207/10545_1 /TAXON_ID=3005 /ORGANISM="Rhizosolenia setigera, Strain CCMP 1694" /LENGTH=462 /DNA_ID=CAMNT_0020638949 /DNA_START=77 /DNA_END=1465 /DNA_ORIENTATION=-
MTAIKEFTYGEVNTPLLSRAMGALLKYHENKSAGQNKKQLLGDDSNVLVQFGLLNVPGNGTSIKTKPIRILLPHPYYKVDKNDDDENSDDEDELEKAEICLFVKDDETKKVIQEMIAKLPKHLGCIKKVMELQSLRKKHSSYEQRRELMAKFDLFLADERILPMIGKAVGSKFFDVKKKTPIPINVTRKNSFPFALKNVLKSTLMYLPNGPCFVVKAGVTSMSKDNLIKNCEQIIKQAPLKIPKKWKNILNISIKTTESTSLPVYNTTPEELLEFADLVEEETPETPSTTTDNNKGKKHKKRSREEEKVEQDEAIDDEEEKKKKLKQEKSPLLKALKEQKSASKKKKRKQEDDTEGAKEEASTTSTEKKSSKKKKKKVKDTEETSNTTTKQSDEKEKKKKTKEEFVSSKKFKGAKKGYVFRMGKQGLGYYVDTPPKVNKAALKAVERKRKKIKNSAYFSRNR